MRCHLIAIVSTAALLAGACSVGSAEDAGPSASRSFTVGDFDGIAVSGPFDVNVATGKAPSVSVQGPQKLVDTMEVVVENGTLRIRTKQKTMLSFFSRGSGHATVTVSARQINDAAIAGSGGINLDRVSDERFAGQISGSGDLRVGDVQVRDVAMKIAGSGSATLAGKAENATYSISGSGDLDGSKLVATNARASIAGSGDLKAQATGTAQASIAGSGDIEITGGAKCQSSKQGSGDIRCS